MHQSSTNSAVSKYYRLRLNPFSLLSPMRHVRMPRESNPRSIINERAGIRDHDNVRKRAAKREGGLDTEQRK